MPVCTPACDDGDACTADACAGGRCRYVERPPATAPAALCSADNLRGMLRLAPPALRPRLNRVETLVQSAARAPAPTACRRKLRAGLRAARALERWVTRQEKGAVIAPQTAGRLVGEAKRLRGRVEILATAGCETFQVDARR